MSDRVDVVSEWTDEDVVAAIVEVANEASRRGRVIEESLEDKSFQGKHHELMLAPDGTRLAPIYIPIGANGSNMALLLTVFDGDPRIVGPNADR